MIPLSQDVGFRMLVQKQDLFILYSFSHHGRNPSLNIRTERYLCGADVTDLPGLPLTKAKVSLARPAQWPFNQAAALLRTWEQCYFLSQIYKDRVCRKRDRQNLIEVNASGGFRV